MSILECRDLQIWNNAAFDNGDSEDSAPIKASWSHLQPIFVNISESIESDSGKENQSPTLGKSPVSVKSPKPIKPLHPNGAIGNSQGNPTKLLSKQGLVVPSAGAFKNGSVEEIRDEGKIDSEIEEIKMEISRLSLRLEALRLEKAERNASTTERRGRIVPAKFMEQKQSGKNLGALKRIDEPLSLSGMTKVQRRGVSLGPSEIFAGVRSRQSGKSEITPVQPIQSRRKSCFWKLQEIDEGKVTKERGRSFSPKSRKTISKIQALKHAATTVGSKKPVKKEDGVISSIQPKKLFKDGEKSVPAKKPFKTGRVVASRYNQTPIHSTGNSTMRKRSLPENDKEDGKEIVSCRKRASVGKSGGILPESCPSQGMESRAKKRWEIPSEAVVYKSMVVDKSPPTITKMPDVLPNIRTVRYVNESPRDSGAAKRVAELIGRKSYFDTVDEEVEPSVCQALSFEEEDVEEK